MKLSIENIGKIKKADIELNGITVICGDNNTGKSTVGKVLFCIFNACYDIDKTIFKQMCISKFYKIERQLKKQLYEDSKNNEIYADEATLNSFRERSLFNCYTQDIVDLFESMPNDLENGIRKIDDFFSLFMKQSYYELIAGSKQLYTEVYNSIVETFQTPIEPYKISIINNFFNKVFDEQHINVNSTNAFVSAKIKNDSFKIIFTKGKETQLSWNFEFTNRAIFIDSPNEYKIDVTDWNKNSIIRGRNTLESLIQNMENENSETADIERVIIEERLEEVSKVLNKVIKGSFKRNALTKRKSFMFDGVNKPISISNLSTGVQSLLLFKSICESGKLSERDVLILDEPEIHLHPEWQLIYAEAIVLLQKKLDLTVLITSHSPAFVRAIECYCDYYDRMKELDVFKTKQVSDYEYTLENLSYKDCGVSEIYEEFSRPYTILDQMLDDKYNGM